MSEEAVIDVTGLERYFGSQAALNGINLTVPRGQVFGIVGENGAGKTTLIKHILGLYRAQHGEVRVFGMDPIQHPREVLARIGYLSEEPDLPAWMRISELMRYMAAFYPNWDSDYATELLNAFQLDPAKKIKELSKGQRARAGLVAAQAHRPDLLLLDEPSSGLDPIVRRDILGAVIRTVVDEGRTVVFSSHLLSEVERVSDQVTMISSGKLVLDGPLDDVLGNHCRLVLGSGPQGTRPALPGQLSCEQQGSHWTVICQGQGEELGAAARAAGWELLDELRVSLDEIFLARSGVHAESGKKVA